MGWKRRKRKLKKALKKAMKENKRGDNNMLDSLQKIQNASRVNNTNRVGQPYNNPNRPYGSQFGFGLQTRTPVEECWESGIEVLKSCGSAPANIEVTISNIAMAKINALMSHYVRMEWLAYLIGSDNHITDIVIPKQKVTPVKVEVDPKGVDVVTMGVIHSHHDMGNGFSSTDDDYINQNHDMSLCISHQGINGVVRMKTACNKYIMVKANVRMKTEGFHEGEFIKDANKLITEKTYVTRVIPYQSQGYSHSASDIAGTGMNTNPLGIVDLADAFVKDLTESPELFDLMDLVGYKEILQEAIKPAKNMDIFLSLYNNLLDNNSFIEDDTHFNAPIELLDEIDSAFATMSNQEQIALVSLLKKMTIVVGEIEEELFAEHVMENDITVIGSSTADLPDETEEFTKEEWCQNDTWEAEQPDVEKKDDTKPSDNIWSTNGLTGSIN